MSDALTKLCGGKINNINFTQIININNDDNITKMKINK
jgi:hypothetical protein